jgi:hypothetical protein
MAGVARSKQTAKNLWNRFLKVIPRLKTCLLSTGKISVTGSTTSSPIQQTYEHLYTVFPGEQCPIAAFQHTFQASFL